MKKENSGLYKYRVPKLKNEFEAVMKRDGIGFSYEMDSDGCEWVVTAITSHRFHDEVKDAVCEKQYRESGDGIPVYSFETVMNTGKFIRLQMFYWNEPNPDKAAARPYRVLPGHDASKLARRKNKN